jgi:hypothetical protein
MFSEAEILLSFDPRHDKLHFPIRRFGNNRFPFVEIIVCPKFVGVESTSNLPVQWASSHSWMFEGAVFFFFRHPKKEKRDMARIISMTKYRGRAFSFSILSMIVDS